MGDSVMNTYDYMYTFKWKKNNIEIQKYFVMKENERIRLLREAEEAKRLAYLKMTQEHDEEIVRKHLADIHSFKPFFRASIDAITLDELYKSDFEVNDSQTMIVSLRDSFPDSVAVLISVRAKEGKSPMKVTWMHTLDVNSLFLEHLNLYEYETI